MNVTALAIIMAFLCSNVLILAFYVFRRQFVYSNLFSIKGVFVLYMVSVLRLLLPLETPWARGICFPALWNPLFRVLWHPVWTTESFSVNVGTVLVTAWAVVAFCMLVRLALLYCHASIELQRMKPRKTPRLENMLDRISGGKCSKGQIAVGTVTQLKVPLSTGILHPMIILPDEEYSDVELYHIILHEYTHIRHNDVAVKLLLHVLCCLWWWNPFVWILRRDMEQMQEIRCDHAIIEGMDRASIGSYMKTVVMVLKSLRCCDEKEETLLPDALCLLHNKPQEIKERFEMMQRKADNAVRNAGTHIFGIVLCAIVIMASYTFVLSPGFEPDISEIETGSHTKEINFDQDVFMKNHDGTYQILMRDGTIIPVTQEQALKYKELGIYVEE